MIVVIVFLSILNQMEFHLVQNRKENCHHDYIPFDVKGNGNIVFSVWLKFLIKESANSNIGGLAIQYQSARYGQKNLSQTD